MNSKNPYVVAIPLKGLVVSDSVLPTDLFDRHWTLVGHSSIVALARLHGEDSSLYGNILQIEKRLRPTGFLLVRYFEGQQRHVNDEYCAELVLASLSMMLLLRGRADRPDAIHSPICLSRARYPEACDLPITFFADRIRSVGHSTGTGLVPLDAGWHTPAFTSEQIDEFVKDAPKIIQTVLADPHVRVRKMPVLIDSMMAIQAAWQNLTPGGFISSFVSACELLVDSGGQLDTTQRVWRTKIDRLTAIVGSERLDLVKKIAGARHRFVHQSRQPETDELTFSALALAINTWSVVNKLYEVFLDANTVELILDCAYQNERAIEHGLTAGMNSVALPSGVVDSLEWVKHYLDKV